MLIRTLLVWLVGLPVTIFIFIIVIISLAFDRSGNSIHSIGALWSRILLFLSGVTVELKGAENLFQDSPQILASNHRGAFDILALQGFIPIQFRWVAKKSLFKIPIIGWSMSLAGYVSIDREKAGSAYKSIERAAEKVKKGGICRDISGRHAKRCRQPPPISTRRVFACSQKRRPDCAGVNKRH